MVLTTDAIRTNLAGFVKKWQPFAGSDKAGAQEYLIDLMACYGQSRESLDARFEQNQSGKFMDMGLPQPTDTQRARIAEIAAELYTLRNDLSIKHQIGLTTLYNRMDDGAFEDLAKLHRRLDQAVAEAYGWPKAVASDPVESNRLLLALNHQIVDGEREYSPFADHASSPISAD